MECHQELENLNTYCGMVIVRFIVAANAIIHHLKVLAKWMLYI